MYYEMHQSDIYSFASHRLEHTESLWHVKGGGNIPVAVQSQFEIK